MNTLTDKAITNVRDICTHALTHGSTDGTLIIFDRESDLSNLLVDAFVSVLPNADLMEFASYTQSQILAAIDTRAAGDLVVLIQSTNFRLDEFRIRIELFNRGLKTIEFGHLNRMSEDQYETYINALAYDPDYYRPLGRALKEKVDAVQNILVRCEGTELVYQGGMEDGKLNVGDYSTMKNVGGTFPIGEVFSEPKDFSGVNGSVRLYAFAGVDHMLRVYNPFTVHIEKGVIVGCDDAPKEFYEILDLIKEDEEVMVREFGMSLNPAIGKGRILNDVTAFERELGLHISLGAKHGIYNKPGIGRKKARYHIDVFVDVQEIIFDGQVIYADGNYIV